MSCEAPSLPPYFPSGLDSSRDPPKSSWSHTYRHTPPTGPDVFNLCRGLRSSRTVRPLSRVRRLRSSLVVDPSGTRVALDHRWRTGPTPSCPGTLLSGTPSSNVKSDLPDSTKTDVPWDRPSYK